MSRTARSPKKGASSTHLLFDETLQVTSCAGVQHKLYSCPDIADYSIYAVFVDFYRSFRAYTGMLILEEERPAPGEACFPRKTTTLSNWFPSKVLTDRERGQHEDSRNFAVGSDAGVHSSVCPVFCSAEN